MEHEWILKLHDRYSRLQRWVRLASQQEWRSKERVVVKLAAVEEQWLVKAEAQLWEEEEEPKLALVEKRNG
jgi:hypothetical protein